MGPGDLAKALAGLPFQSHPNLIVGMERAEDAGVYKLTEDLAIVQTVDFFTPIVDDPYDFGRIAAANSLSDVYAMGGSPLTALNVVCFPQDKMEISILKEVLRGGLDKMHEAGVILVGGHSVEDPELKYGLSVTGTIHPDKVICNNGAKAGDRLILTKPLGTGIISTAIKGGIAGDKATAKIVKSMTTLNRTASELMQEVGVHACTDITGFGLLGHAAEMIECTEVGMVIDSVSVPYFPEVKELAERGMIPGGLHRNRDFRKDMVDIDESVPQYLQDILYDPQTSGGLLIAVPHEKAWILLEKLHGEGVAEAAIIGEVAAEPKGRIRVG
ncbi:MAG: selenide, water dikinase SelD [Dehalococcoidales bacterium]|nr:selenide, water dikinase SelD [Dehalococcoidales bacterium]